MKQNIVFLCLFCRLGHWLGYTYILASPYRSVIECEENVFTKPIIEKGDIMAEKDIKAIGEDVIKMQKDLDDYYDEICSHGENLRDMRKDISFLKSADYETSKKVLDIEYRLQDIEGLMWCVIKRLDELLPNKKIDTGDYRYFEEASTRDE